MKIAVAASDLPHPQGTAAGRDLWAWCEAVRALGHELEAWIWYRSPLSPAGPVPDWARYEPIAPEPRLRAHLRGLLLPRADAARGNWRPPGDAVAVADHLLSASAVLGCPRSVVTLHYRAMLDARAIGRIRPRDLQTARGEHRAAKRADLVLAYSTRVAAGLPGRAPVRTVPITHPVPAEALPPVDAPVAGLLADWTWGPNRLALHRLLTLWPEVLDALPGARLLLGGRGIARDAFGPVPGVEFVGEVGDSLEVLGRVAVVAFPCPPSSGPKVKTLEALAHGVPVCTTAAGMEGIGVGDGVRRGLVAEDRFFATALVGLLRAPEERRRLGGEARAAVAEHHAPIAAATARLEAFAHTFGA